MGRWFGREELILHRKRCARAECGKRETGCSRFSLGAKGEKGRGGLRI